MSKLQYKKTILRIAFLFYISPYKSKLFSKGISYADPKNTQSCNTKSQSFGIVFSFYISAFESELSTPQYKMKKATLRVAFLSYP
jgi:hypothetical protein